MDLNNTILPEKEKKWTAFLNGEPDIPDNSGLDEHEKAEMMNVWESAGTSFCYSAVNSDKAWNTLQSEISKPDMALTYRILKSRVFQFAAMILIVIGIGYSAYQFMHIPVKQVYTSVRMVVAQTGEHPDHLTEITLSDGSTVKVNANSRLEYPEHFVGNIRKIKLSGEAFFEVLRDTLRPFIIETVHASVEVLGTSFNVMAYPHADLVEVNVRTGRVKLTQYAEGESGRKSAVLPAGERGWLKVADGEIGVANALAPNYSSWINKKISFQHTPLSEAFSVLENTYHVKLRMEDPGIGTLPYTANFADLKLEYILEVIARTHHLKVKRVDNEIIFARIVN